ncbi:hypothetical protein FQR65_LT16260 [Abscondita terminalis]|nr:hypothetical protein FQR65_LT16260 [Abscondita terminalis]
MASAIEALGMSLPYSSSNPAVSSDKKDECLQAGSASIRRSGSIEYFLDEGLLHGDCLTVTGKTLAENLADVKSIMDYDQKIIQPLSNPIKPSGHLQILYGNLAEKGSVAKISGKEGEKFTGPARVFDGEQNLIRGIQDGTVKKGDVVVIINEGPVGSFPVCRNVKAHPLL